MWDIGELKRYLFVAGSRLRGVISLTIAGEQHQVFANWRKALLGLAFVTISSRQ
jgi:hypothetical protein